MHMERLSPSSRWSVYDPAQASARSSFLRLLRFRPSREEACSRAETLRYSVGNHRPGARAFVRFGLARRTRFNPQLRKGAIMATKRLTLQQRRDIFRDLVATQDLGTGVRRSYQIVQYRLRAY